MDGNPETRVTMALAQMAVFRCADVSAETLQLFTTRLLAEKCAVDDIVRACGQLERAEREPGETAFPTLGTLLTCIGRIAQRRYEDQRMQEWHDENNRRLADAYNVPTAEQLESRERAMALFRNAGRRLKHAS